MRADKEYRFKLRGGERFEAKMRDRERHEARTEARKDKVQFVKAAPEKGRQ